MYIAPKLEQSFWLCWSFSPATPHRTLQVRTWKIVLLYGI